MYLTTLKIFYYRNNIMIIFFYIALVYSINIYLLYGPKIIDANINIFHVKFNDLTKSKSKKMLIFSYLHIISKKKNVNFILNKFMLLNEVK